ncbi:MAG: UvrD-helicase domain-containing protein, partial [Syntrophomonadaceae bacterium]|nr:UvrD-helicase domain-containing protein [Syntrophomonadaceae bacterium]
SLMATTFTNRAAAELRERIRVDLLKRGRHEDADRIYDGFIGTVNSICSRLLKEYALEAGMSPAVDIMPEEDSRRIFGIAIDRVINGYSDQMEPAARRLEMDGRGSGYQTTADWRDHVKAIVDLARANQISPVELLKCAQRSWDSLQALFGQPLNSNPDSELERVVALAISQLQNLDSLTKATQGTLDKLQDCHQRIRSGQITWSDWIRLAKLSPAKDGKEIIEPVQVVADLVLQHSQFQADVRQIIEGAFQCAGEALEQYETFKRKAGLMDFVDQETRVLDLAIHNEAFRKSLGDRIQVLLVDEFQDTSPVQLALFLALHEVAKRSVWVGDPKQAIYGFRGTDPQLMEQMVALISDENYLNYSWRSRENLLEFTNALFKEVFYEMGVKKVCLEIPPQRRGVAEGGRLEGWHLLAKNFEDEAAATANGVRNLLEQSIKPGDIAVLGRTNEYCAKIAFYMEKLGIRASVGQGSLLEARECQLALAALRYMNNPANTVALAEIVHLSPMHHSHSDWLAALMINPAETIKDWLNDPMIATINEGHSDIHFWTPMEALEQAINRVDLLYTLKSWPNPALAMSNLDALRQVCTRYIDQCKSRRTAATVEGYLTYFEENAPEQARGSGEQTVTICTYHGAKGLEWPWVVLTGLDSAPRADVFGVNIEAASQFEPADPLAGRKIRYWPWPFGGQKTYPVLDERMESLPLDKEIREKAVQEAQRLMYVGMTRARDGLVMAMRKSNTRGEENLKTGWLDALTDAEGKQVIEWNTDVGLTKIQVGKASISINMLEFGSEVGDWSDMEAFNDDCYISDLPTLIPEYLVARVSPSSLSLDNGSEVALEVMANFNTRIAIKGNPEMDLVGNAIHTYLGVDYRRLTDEKRLRLAGDILNRWGMEFSLAPEEVVRAGENLTTFLEQNYQQYRSYKEWPISLRNLDKQLMQGWIDLLLETPQGYVIIDHKSYPGVDAAERAAKYAPQLSIYQDAVEKATGRPVLDLLLHLPVSGIILRYTGK